MRRTASSATGNGARRRSVVGLDHVWHSPHGDARPGAEALGDPALEPRRFLAHHVPGQRRRHRHDHLPSRERRLHHRHGRCWRVETQRRTERGRDSWVALAVSRRLVSPCCPNLPAAIGPSRPPAGPSVEGNLPRRSWPRCRLGPARVLDSAPPRLSQCAARARTERRCLGGGGRAEHAPNRHRP
jgi:hypothetical protein